MNNDIHLTLVATASGVKFQRRPERSKGQQQWRRRPPSPCAAADPELFGPAAPTPRETKRLSDLDDQETLRGPMPLVFFYRGGGPRAGDDPAGVIRRALGEALVPYYPLAGRLREVEARKLVVDCAGQGAVFVEADADVRLAELEAAATGLRPPFPCMDQLLFLSVVESSGFGTGVLGCPLLLVQVTRLLCGGFVLALCFNHTICDGVGIAQFISAVAELARGLPMPTVVPAWSRELLYARSPPKPVLGYAARLSEYDDGDAPAAPAQQPPPEAMVMRTFTLGPSDIAAIRKGLPPRLRDTATTLEVLAAALWRARTAALELPAGAEVRLRIVVNLRGMPELGLPAGYYGNACIPSAVATTAGALLAGSLGDAVELVRAAKAAVTAEYVRSTVDMLVLRGRPALTMAVVFFVSDSRHMGFHRVDMGWGEPVYGGAPAVMFGGSFIVAVRTSDGEDAVAVPIMLPPRAMDRFASEIDVLLTGPSGQNPGTRARL